MGDYSEQEVVTRVRGMFPEGIIEVGTKHYCPSRKGVKIRNRRYYISLSGGWMETVYYSDVSFRDCVKSVSGSVLVIYANRQREMSK